MGGAGDGGADGPAGAVARAPRTKRGERTRAALIDAAAAEFGEKGFHATGITDITRRAGVALGSFYTWFDSKEAIFRAVPSLRAVRLVAVDPVRGEFPDCPHLARLTALDLWGCQLGSDVRR
ncbi:MAG: helix-turn-helix domain-containing protein, partial [Thermaurantiacus tibetensis]